MAKRNALVDQVLGTMMAPRPKPQYDPGSLSWLPWAMAGTGVGVPAAAMYIARDKKPKDKGPKGGGGGGSSVHVVHPDPFTSVDAELKARSGGHRPVNQPPGVLGPSFPWPTPDWPDLTNPNYTAPQNPLDAIIHAMAGGGLPGGLGPTRPWRGGGGYTEQNEVTGGHYPWDMPERGILLGGDVQPELGPDQQNFTPASIVAALMASPRHKARTPGRSPGTARSSSSLGRAPQRNPGFGQILGSVQRANNLASNPGATYQGAMGGSRGAAIGGLELAALIAALIGGGAPQPALG